MKRPTYQYSETYGGGDGRAIDRHSSKVYEDEQSNKFILDRDLSIVPPCFEAIGPIPKGFQGICPIIKINGERYFGDGITWQQAEKIFFEAIDSL